MTKRGKKIQNARGVIDRNRTYPASEGIKLARESAFTKFDESVDVAVRLGVNPRHADQNVRGSVMLPRGSGKTVRVLVFAQGEKAKEAQVAGADHVGGKDMVERIQKEGFLDFDVAIATPDMMPLVGRIGRILGPRGLMPNPKTGSVTMDISRAVQAARGGKVDFRVDKAGIVHLTIGRRSFSVDHLRENLHAVLEVLMRVKPPSAKGNYLRGITLSTTMGPGVRIDPVDLLQS